MLKEEEGDEGEGYSSFSCSGKGEAETEVVGPSCCNNELPVLWMVGEGILGRRIDSRLVLKIGMQLSGAHPPHWLTT